ncbi:MAG: hypothetical protein IKE65_07140 [Clostridia bacterium]|nr:hypothetical protein [Clostridia bacterium]
MAKRKANNPYYKHMPTISVRRIIHHVCAFILTLLVFMMAGSLSTITGFLNESALKSAIENQEFYAEVRKNIVNECQSIAIPSMIDEDVFYELFTQEKIASDLKAYISAGVEGKNFSFDTDGLENTTVEKITAYFKEQNTPITQQLQKDIKLFAVKVIGIYQTGISISYIDSYAQLKGTAKPIALILFAVSLVLTIALLFFMIAIYRFKVLHKTIRMFAYALGGAGLMLAGLFGYCKFFYIGSGLQIIPEFLYKAMHRYIQHGLTTYIFAGVLLMIFSLALAFVSESLRRRVKTNYFARLEANFRENLNDELETKNFTPDLDMTNREEEAKRVAHDEFNRYAKDRLDSVTLNEENERPDKKEFDLPIVSAPAHDDFTEVNVDEDKDE